MRALVTGGGGQLASDLAEQLPNAVALGRTQLDITDDEAVARAFDDVEPATVFNCAAFHNVEVCETEEDRSFEVNARAVKRLAQRCEEAGATLVHLSTNYVFDGTRAEPYAEDDRPNPRSIYALSKLAGEYAALAYCSKAIVARSSGLYGLHGSASKGGNFVTRMIARARDQGQLKMVADQRLNPTFTGDLAAGLIEAVDKDAGGILHITNSGDCSWHEFTVEIMRVAEIDVPIEPVKTTRGTVDRPLNGVLARPRTDAAGLTPLRSWRDALADYLAS
ncbi:MAG: dTDP-4-dehydrorhamnose reductase [Thermoleophilaceae bacterium]|nr:dTDP-4-dehydrorhamnose reductase [Thermoleophilaceae bacterium]